MDKTQINYGDGGSALCVLVPPFNFNNTKYDDNYVSKISSISNYGVKMTIDRELILSKILKETKSKSKKWIEDHFILIDDYKIFNNNFKYLYESKSLESIGCKLEDNEEYIIMYSKNGGCKPLKRGDIVSIEQKRLTGLYDIRPFKYLGKENNMFILETIDTNKHIFYSENITRFCGDLSNHYILYKLFGDVKSRKKNIKHIIESLAFLVNSGIIHCDIKLKNFVSNEKGKIKLIDFGGSFSLKNNEYFNFTSICNKIISNSNNKLELRTQQDSTFIDNILDFISIHTEYYTPPEILIMKLFLQKKTQREIFEYIIDVYNIKDADLIKQKIVNIISYVSKNKRKMIYNIQCNTENINTFIYKFDIFSLGIMFREISKILYKYFNIIVEDEFIDLFEKMTDFNFIKRLNIDQIINHDYLL